MNATEALQTVSLILNAVGCILLSALVITVSLSQRLHRRDPVFNSFLYTWILRSSLNCFDLLAILSGKTLGEAAETREEVTGAITTVATLNLSIHLWYIMRGAFHESSTKARKIRTLALVVTSYVLGLLPIVELYTKNTVVLGLVVYLPVLVISALTTMAGVILLIYYFRSYRKLRKANVHGFLSLPFFLRLLVFGVYQLIFEILAYLDLPFHDSTVWIWTFNLLKNIFPILAFCILGLHTDILQLWFPWWNFGRKDSGTVSVTALAVMPEDDKVNPASDKMDDTERLLSAEPPGHDGFGEYDPEQNIIGSASSV